MPGLLSPEEEAKFAAETVTATKFLFYHAADRKALAREALRRMTKYDDFRTDDGAANIALEQIWNVLVGNYDHPDHQKAAAEV